jgi:hypothetical protein
MGQLGSTAAQAAGTGQTNLTQLGNAQSQLAAQQQGLSLADINALSTLGGQQQTIAQNQQLFPLNNLSTLSGMLRGYSVPTTTKTTASASPLSVVGGAITGTAGLFTKNPASGLTPYDSLISGLGNAYNKMTGTDPNTGGSYLNIGGNTSVTGADASGSGTTMNADTAAELGYVQNPYGGGYVDPATLEQGP